jgi:diguanylate cyclase (GGDEF)-like protein
MLGSGSVELTAMTTQVPSIERLLAIIDLQNDLASTRAELDEVMRKVVDRAGPLVGAAGAVLELADGDEMVYRAVAGSAAQSAGTRLKRAHSLSGRCVDEKTALRSDDTATDERVDREACRRVGAASMICVPVLQNGSAVGVVEVLSPETNAFDDEDVATLGLLARVVAASMQTSLEYAVALGRGVQDPLTGLLNRRAFDERLGQELDRKRRYAQPLSLALLDLDGFQAANDRLGHAAGDEVLRRVAAILPRALRIADMCFRVGADEFALILPSTAYPGARLAVDRCTSEVEAAHLASSSIGVSAGVVEVRDGETAAAVVARADAKLADDKKRKKGA